MGYSKTRCPAPVSSVAMRSLWPTAKPEKMPFSIRVAPSRRPSDGSIRDIRCPRLRYNETWTLAHPASYI